MGKHGENMGDLDGILPKNMQNFCLFWMFLTNENLITILDFQQHKLRKWWFNQLKDETEEERMRTGVDWGPSLQLEGSAETQGFTNKNKQWRGEALTCHDPTIPAIVVSTFLNIPNFGDLIYPNEDPYY